jgi:hypothetical protein
VDPAGSDPSTNGEDPGRPISYSEAVANFGDEFLETLLIFERHHGSDTATTWSSEELEEAVALAEWEARHDYHHLEYPYQLPDAPTEEEYL